MEMIQIRGADPIGGTAPAEATIEIRQGEGPFDHSEAAANLARVLHATLARGTIDRLVVRLLDDKVSDLVIAATRPSNNRKLFRVQDADRPMFMLAASWTEALQAWKAQIAFENEMAVADVEEPRGIELVAEASEILIGGVTS